MFLIYFKNQNTNFWTVFFWKLRSIGKFLIQNQICAILGAEIFAKQNWVQQKKTSTYLYYPKVVLTDSAWPWDAPSEWPEHPLRDWGQLGASEGLSGYDRASKVISRPLWCWWEHFMSILIWTCLFRKFVLSFKHLNPPKIANNWFCIYNLHMDLSFQKKKTAKKSVYWFWKYQTNKHCNVFF